MDTKPTVRKWLLDIKTHGKLCGVLHESDRKDFCSDRPWEGFSCKRQVHFSASHTKKRSMFLGGNEL